MPLPMPSNMLSELEKRPEAKNLIRNLFKFN